MEVDPHRVILETFQLRKEFGALVAVDDVSLKVRANSIHAIIGPNGAGKTTLFNLLSRSFAPTSGRVFFNGEEITHLPVHRIAHLGIGRSYQITNLFPDLTVLENVRLACQALGNHNFNLFQPCHKYREYEERALEVLRIVGLGDRALAPASLLPHGDKRKLELAIILAPDPKLLLLDEPTAGLASEQVPEMMALIHHINQAGKKTIVLVEHNMNLVMNTSDFITVMHQGRILAEGTPAEIAADKTVQVAYLGGLYGEFAAPGAG